MMLKVIEEGNGAQMGIYGFLLVSLVPSSSS